MFSSKAISAAIELSMETDFVTTLAGFTDAELREVAAVLECDGQDELAYEVRTLAG
jgi:translation elongation factor EF-Ts